MWFLALAVGCTPYEPDPIPPVRTFEAPDETAHTGVGPHTGDTAEPQVPPFDGPLLLSEAGLYADLQAEVLADGIVPYTPAWPLWSDGSDKRRWIGVPAGQQIDTSDPDHWVFPAGTRAFKEFTRDGVRVETRLFEKRASGWEFVSYAWRADGTDADAVPDGADDVLGTPHDIPSRLDCSRCHVGPADLFLGVSAIQLGVGGQGADQLPLTAPVPADVPGDTVQRPALGYLVGNCASCHRDGTHSGDASGLWLDVPVGLTDAAEAPALQTGVGTRAQHIVAGTTEVLVPGDPEASQLWVRMGLTSVERMPPQGVEDVDPAGQAVIASWIRSLDD